MENRVVELHDSDIEEIGESEGHILITFSKAIIHKSMGSPGRSNGTVWLQKIQMSVIKGIIIGEFISPETVIRGRLITRKLEIGLIPIPFQGNDYIQIHFEFESGRSFKVSGTNFFIKELGPEKYLESFEENPTEIDPNKREKGSNGFYACSCCGFATLDGVLEYLICPICFWEDDGQDDPLADEFWGGPNGSSLTDARSNYIKCGAYNPEFKKQVRKPNKTDEALRVYKIVDGKLLREK